MIKAAPKTMLLLAEELKRQCRQLETEYSELESIQSALRQLQPMERELLELNRRKERLEAQRNQLDRFRRELEVIAEVYRSEENKLLQNRSRWIRAKPITWRMYRLTGDAINDIRLT